MIPGGTAMMLHREQLPLEPAYVFTDYCSQGQSIPYVIVDIDKSPSDGLTPFNAYIAPSRSVGLDCCVTSVASCSQRYLARICRTRISDSRIQIRRRGRVYPITRNDEAEACDLGTGNHMGNGNCRCPGWAVNFPLRTQPPDLLMRAPLVRTHVDVFKPRLHIEHAT